MSVPTECPACKADLRQKPPPHYRGKGELSRVIGVIVNDMVFHWECPDCGHQWPRSTEAK